MLGLDLSEIVIIMVVALIVFGPEKLPEIARELGKWMGQMRRTADSVRRDFYNEVYPPAQELRRELIEASRELRVVGHEVRGTLDSDSTKQPPTALPATSSAASTSVPTMSAAVPADAPNPDATARTEKPS